MVRASNAAPELLGVRVDGVNADTAGATTLINALEGQPLAIEVFGGDADLDRLNWSAGSLPPGMVLQTPDVTSGSGRMVKLMIGDNRFMPKTVIESNEVSGGIVKPVRLGAADFLLPV